MNGVVGNIFIHSLFMLYKFCNMYFYKWACKRKFTFKFVWRFVRLLSNNIVSKCLFAYTIAKSRYYYSFIVFIFDILLPYDTHLCAAFDCWPYLSWKSFPASFCPLLCLYQWLFYCLIVQAEGVRLTRMWDLSPEDNSTVGQHATGQMW